MKPELVLTLLVAAAGVSGCVEQNLPMGGGEGGSDPVASGGCGTTECDGVCTNLDEDPLHCGACGHDCFGGACEAGRCQATVLTTGEFEAGAIAVDETHVYWGTQADLPQRAIKRMRIDGTEKETLSTTESTNAFQMVVDDTHIYWTYREPPYRIMRMPKVGGAEQELAEASYPTGLAIDGEFVYWANYWKDPSPTTTTGNVRKVPLAGGPAVTISDDEPYARSIATGGGRVIWSQEHVADHLGKIRAWSASGILTLATQQGRPGAVITDGIYAYWAAPLDGTVMRADFEGGEPVALATGEEGAGEVMRDGDRLYWVTGHSIRAMPITGGEVTTVYRFGRLGAGIVQDSRSFYWTQRYSGKIWRLAKPL